MFRRGVRRLNKSSGMGVLRMGVESTALLRLTIRLQHHALGSVCAALCWEDLITFSPEHASSSAGTNLLMQLLRSAVVYYPIFQAWADWYEIS